MNGRVILNVMELNPETSIDDLAVTAKYLAKSLCCEVTVVMIEELTFKVYPEQ